LLEKLRPAGVSEIEIERSINNLKITVYVSKPGMVIGRAGTGLEELKTFIQNNLVKKSNVKNQSKLDIRVEPVKEPNLDAYLVARNVSDQLIRRLPAKRVLAATVERVMGSGAKGVRIVLSGRVGGAEISRREKLQVGTVPLSTIRANINYASSPALTKKGYIGVKVWINRPEEK
jgi:small subunit ribosomal protein S3